MRNRQASFVPYIAPKVGTDYNHKHYRQQQISNEDMLITIAFIFIVPLIVWFIFKQQDK